VFLQDIEGVRTERTTEAALALLRRAHGDVATATSLMIRLACTNLRYDVRDARHQISAEGRSLLRAIQTRMDFSPDYSKGFDSRPALTGVLESLFQTVVLGGACSAELVLDESLLPHQLVPVSPSTLTWVKVGGDKQQKRGAKSSEERKAKMVPSQRVAGQDVVLDIPTLFYASLDQDPTTAYPEPYIAPAANTSLFHSEVLNDIRRVLKRAAYSRMTAELNSEVVNKMVPQEIRNDPKKKLEFLTLFRDQTTQQLSDLKPEDALVYYDYMNMSLLDSKVGSDANFTPIIEAVDGLQATALKTPPSVLGKRMGGSQNTSSTESLLFLKTAAGIVPPVETVLSRAFTLALRLYGFPGTVRAYFAPPDLRPDIETEAFKIQKQRRMEKLLSMGRITDEEFNEQLGLGPLPPGAPLLSGTMFQVDTFVDNPSPNGDPARQALTPVDTPEPGGRPISD
jgi:hypothetical protein